MRIPVLFRRAPLAAQLHPVRLDLVAAQRCVGTGQRLPGGGRHNCGAFADRRHLHALAADEILVRMCMGGACAQGKIRKSLTYAASECMCVCVPGGAGRWDRTPRVSSSMKRWLSIRRSRAWILREAPGRKRHLVAHNDCNRTADLPARIYKIGVDELPG